MKKLKKIKPLVFAILFFSIIFSSCGSSRHKHVYMRRTYKTVKKALKGIPITKTNDSIKIVFPANLVFQFNSSIIDSNALPIMQNLSIALNKRDQTAVLISGFTDSIGSDEFNNELSTLRAVNAKAILLNHQIVDERINIWGMGRRHPAASNDTEEGRAKNRRVEFVVLYKEIKK